MIVTKLQWQSLHKFGRLEYEIPIVQRTSGIGIKPCRFRQGESYAVQRKAGRRAITRAIAQTVIRDDKAGVWRVLFVQDLLDRDRYLAADSSRGYTNSTVGALKEEPPAIDEVTQRRYAAEALERDALTRLVRVGEIRNLAVDEQIGKLTDIGKKCGVDLSKDRRVIAARMRAMANKIAKAS